MKITKILITLTFIFFLAMNSRGQLPMTKTVSGQLSTVESGMLQVPPKDRYTRVADSLDKNLLKNKNDTLSLFNRSLIYYLYNQMLAQPYQRTKGTLENLTKAKDLIEKAIENGMKDFRAKQLRAQIYCELCYRFTGDESWMFNKTQSDYRKQIFNGYKEKANRYLDELSELDKPNAYAYSKKKVSYVYKL
jgi:Flp pilus assembly protein TadD